MCRCWPFSGNPSAVTSATQWFKYSKTFVDFQQPGTTVFIKIFDLVAAGNIHAVKAKVSTAFTIAPNVPLTMRVLDNVDIVDLLANFDPKTAVTGTNVFMSGMKSPYFVNQGATRQIDAVIFDPTGAQPMTNLTAGAVDFWFLLSKAI